MLYTATRRKILSNSCNDCYYSTYTEMNMLI
jgi:hypothetical protein